jgi:serine phosphatase RsbU (regulator of sigma subunit)/ligand-binding sensor domain-containing protein
MYHIRQSFAFILLSCLFSLSFLYAQEIGSPFSRNYHATEFKAHMQNWAATQDHRGVLYFANKEGVLEYDGGHWNLIKVSRDVRSLDVDTEGTVFVGAIGDFGYLAPDLTGKLQFTSLLSLLDTGSRNFEDVWKVYATNEGVYYQSSKWIIRYKKGKIKIWYPQKPNGFHFAYWLRGRLYVRENGVGLLELKDEQLAPAQGGDVFADERIYAMLPYDSQRVLIGTRNLGLFVWNPDNGELQKFATPAHQFLIDNQLYHGIKLRNGNFVFATITGGAVVLNATGQVEQTINKQAFLQNESVYYLYNDRQNNLWMALDNGISNIEIESPWLQWNETHGLRGIVYSVMRHNGVLYVGTSQGAFFLENNNFVQIEGIKGQTWDLLSIPEKQGLYASKLLIGNATGIYEVEKNKARQLFAGSHCLKLYHSKHEPHKIYTGFDNSLALITLQGSTASFQGKIKDIEGEIRNITEDDEGNVIINIPFRGLCVISPSEKAAKFSAAEIVYIGEDKGFNTVESEVFTLHGKLYFTKNKKLYHFNETDGKFEENPLLDKYLNIGNITHLANDSMGDIWMALILNSSKKEAIGVLRKQKDGNYADDLESFKRLPQMSIQEVYPEDNGIVWIGGSGGLFRYNTEITGYYNTSYNTLIRKVYVNEDSVIFNGNYFKHDEDNDSLRIVSLEQPKEMQFDFGYDFNEITFHFAAPYFTDENQTLYSYYLENFDRTWSVWHNHTTREYTNLSEGNYTFHVKAKNIYGLESKEAMYKFKIHPPWYRTRWAYISYAVTAILLFWITLKTYTQKLQRDKIRLEQLVTERTVELEHQKEEVLSQSADLKILNENMAVKTAELEIQKAEIEKKNDDIKSSLNYAQRIQTALLPQTAKMRSAFDDFFVMIMPRDIVSGDYYWFADVKKNRPEQKAKQENEIDVRNMRFTPDAREFVPFNGDDYTVPIGFQVLTKYTVITAADCTGHGVPGALMSMIGNNLLNEIVFMRSIIEPNEILSALNTGVRTLLKQDESKNKDGMDMALCVIDWHDKILHFSGAKNPLMYVANGEIIEVKADKKSIGGGMGLAKSDMSNIFAVTSIPLTSTMEFYMSSDGYEDQFGGTENRKFMRKHLRELLFKIHKLPMAEQEKILKTNIIDWMGTNNHQLDDILVVGFRIEHLA